MKNVAKLFQRENEAEIEFAFDSNLYALHSSHTQWIWKSFSCGINVKKWFRKTEMTFFH